MDCIFHYKRTDLKWDAGNSVKQQDMLGTKWTYCGLLIWVYCRLLIETRNLPTGFWGWQHHTDCYNNKVNCWTIFKYFKPYLGYPLLLGTIQHCYHCVVDPLIRINRKTGKPVKNIHVHLLHQASLTNITVTFDLTANHQEVYIKIFENNTTFRNYGAIYYS